VSVCKVTRWLCLCAGLPAGCVCVQGYPLAGLENGRECHCGGKPGGSDNVWRLGKVPDKCNKPCNGDSNTRCGGPWALSVFRTGVSEGQLTQLANCATCNMLLSVLFEFTEQFRNNILVQYSGQMKEQHLTFSFYYISPLCFRSRRKDIRPRRR
jgi:hypothetical protein